MDTRTPRPAVPLGVPVSAGHSAAPIARFPCLRKSQGSHLRSSHVHLPRAVGVRNGQNQRCDPGGGEGAEMLLGSLPQRHVGIASTGRACEKRRGSSSATPRSHGFQSAPLTGARGDRDPPKGLSRKRLLRIRREPAQRRSTLREFSHVKERKSGRESHENTRFRETVIIGPALGVRGGAVIG